MRCDSPTKTEHSSPDNLQSPYSELLSHSLLHQINETDSVLTFLSDLVQIEEYTVPVSFQLHFDYPIRQGIPSLLSFRIILQKLLVQTYHFL